MHQQKEFLVQIWSQFSENNYVNVWCRHAVGGAAPMAQSLIDKKSLLHNLKYINYTVINNIINIMKL